MIKNIFVWILFITISGCVSISPEESYSTHGMSKNRHELTDIHKVMIGVSLKEVEGIMGNETVVGYQQKAADPTSYEAITIKNPYREEILDLKNKTYKVLYYLTEIKKADGLIAEDELTPLVFEGERLIGKGQDHLFKLKNQL